MVGWVYEHYCKRCTTEEENEKLKKKIQDMKSDVIELYKTVANRYTRVKLEAIVKKWQEE